MTHRPSKHAGQGHIDTAIAGRCHWMVRFDIRLARMGYKLQLIFV